MKKNTLNLIFFVLISTFSIDMIAQSSIIPNVQIESSSSGEIVNSDPGFLPIELISFSGTSKGCMNILGWSTQVEVNTSHFEIYGSHDASNFKMVGSVKASGTSVKVNNYSHVLQAGQKRTYYKIKAVDIDGFETESEMIVVNSNCFLNSFGLAPNPTDSDRTEFTFEIDQEIATTVIILDRFGRIVFEEPLTTSIGANRVELSTASLASGSYYVRLRDSEEKPLRLMVIK